jgi:hypothetical protein
MACRETDHGQAGMGPPPSSSEPQAHVLDRGQRVAVQLVRGLVEPERQKFVQVEVGEVVNPALHSLIFEVSFRRPGGEQLQLGSFGLYPADNPGTFIVPTSGLLERDGAIVVSMMVPDEVGEKDPLRVSLKSITLRTQ